MQKKIFKKLTFLPKYRISPVLEEYVSTYAALLKFSKRARERCQSFLGKFHLDVKFHQIDEQDKSRTILTKQRPRQNRQLPKIQVDVITICQNFQGLMGISSLSSRYATPCQPPITLTILHTRKCPLHGHCLAPPGRRQRITLQREKILGRAGLRITELRMDRQTWNLKQYFTGWLICNGPPIGPKVEHFFRILRQNYTNQTFFFKSWTN